MKKAESLSKYSFGKEISQCINGGISNGGGDSSITCTSNSYNGSNPKPSDQTVETDDDDGHVQSITTTPL